MGYALSELTSESLLEFAEEEYDYIKWDKNSLQRGDDYLAVWGWDEDGTYTVALAMYYERSDKEIAALSGIYKEVTAEDTKIIKSGWNLKFIHETEGPIIEPSPNFLKTRPLMTLKGKKELKEGYYFF